MSHELINLSENRAEQTPVEQLEEGLFREYIGKAEPLTIAEESSETVIGDLEDTENWHFQAEQTSCVIAIEEMMAEQLLKKEMPEGKMIEYSQRRGWYEPMTGTSLEDTGKILEALGLEVERGESYTISDLMESLAQGQKVLCAVDGMMLQDSRLAEVPGRIANHAVQLVGIDFSDKQRPQVILNDTFDRNGKGIRYDLDLFVSAWKTSDCFAVMAERGAHNK